MDRIQVQKTIQLNGAKNVSDLVICNRKFTQERNLFVNKKVRVPTISKLKRSTVFSGSMLVIESNLPSLSFVSKLKQGFRLLDCIEKLKHNGSMSRIVRSKRKRTLDSIYRIIRRNLNVV
ncbi:hypothetical protein [Leptospira noguchii]|uniref:hypothetical protein n=1 Tax=Leptospira noguchii TaxID=28182 RepID=UPI0002C029B6|nr:hypothetical protein [Leptospira noguchii]EMI69468.1 hypothetical protein LEP1GSC072_0451 [Leptospira noguchii str. Bonito]